MAIYVYHGKTGPDFVWDQGKITQLLAAGRYRQGRLLGRIEGLGEKLREEARMHIFELDVETFFGDEEGEPFARLLLEITGHHPTPLTRERLTLWHAYLYPGPGWEIRELKAGVHFQASSAESLEGRLTNLIHWVNSASVEPVIKAGVALLWFMLIQPFDRGNERISELVMEALLARENQLIGRYYRVSAQLRREQKEYESILEKMRQSSHDVTPWLEWFLGCFGRAIDNAGKELEATLNKDRFWEGCAGMALNDRQRLILGMMLNGQEDTMTSSRWALLANTSQDTAGRDINELVRRNILLKEWGGGRNTSYRIRAEWGDFRGESRWLLR